MAAESVFDSKESFHAGIFLSGTSVKLTQLLKVGALFQPHGARPTGSALQIRLKAPSTEQEIQTNPDGQVIASLPMIVFKSAGHVWVVNSRVNRLDIVFDAVAYHEIQENRSATLQDFVHACMPSVARASEVLERDVVRLALVADGETLVAPNPCRVASHLLATEIAQEAASGLTPDVNVRVNRRATWELDSASYVINRLTTINAGEHPNAPRLSWQFDVNTDSTRDEAMSTKQIESFFEQALAAHAEARSQIERNIKEAQ